MKIGILILSAAMMISSSWLVQARASDISGQEPASPNVASGQENGKKTVKGTVKSDQGELLTGVMVYIKGTQIGVMTDLDGKYEIEIPGHIKDPVLVYQYIGMTTMETRPGDRSTLDIVLEQDNTIEESVIVGAYGTKQSREDLIGSAFQVNAAEIKDRPKTRVDKLLEGLVPGMTIDPNTDAAGTTRSRYETRIRGEASLSASNEPLWVIDGVPMYTGGKTNQVPGMSYTISPLSMIDPSDIESITVLKDADQVTIYGANGSNGVILVTTKSGKRNTPLRVNATVNYGVASADKSTMFKMMNASQYMTVAKEAWINAGNDISTFPYQDNDMNSYSTTSTDWADQYFGLGSNIYANLSVSSGTDKMSSQITGSYYREENIVQKDVMERYSFRSRNVINFTDWMRLDASLSASYNDNDLFPLSKSYLETLPVFEPYMADGTYRLYNKVLDQGEFKLKKFHDNEIPEREENVNNQKSLKAGANFLLSFRLMKGLEFSTQYSFDYQHSHEDVYYSRLTLGGLDDNGQPVGSTRRADASYTLWTSVSKLDFNRRFGKHHVQAFCGLELHQQKVKTLSGSASGFMNDNIQEISYADESTITAHSNTDIERTMSMFGRAVYSYDSRYYLSLNYRRDGNSGFGIYSKWADFWSAGASWNIHNEPFFDCDAVKMLKLKASYGTNGNSRVDASEATGTYQYSSSTSYMGYSGAVIGTIPNPGLSWETTRMINAAATLELRNGLILELQYYDNYTSDLLSRIYVSRTLSADRVYANVGEIRNNGVEMSLRSVNINRNGFLWTTTFNAAHNRNRIEKLYNGMTTGFFTTLWREGYDSNTYYLVRWAGVDPSDGSPMWYDINGNLTKSYSTSNRVPDKTSTPIVSGGIGNTLSYGNWDLSFHINYTIGGYSLASYASLYFGDGYDIIGSNQAVEVYHYRWTTPGQAAAFPKVSNLSTKSGSYSTRFLYNRTNFQLSNVVLTYRLPQMLADRLKMSSASVSLICDNAYIFTPDQKRGFNSYKTMMYGYPSTRTFTLSLNATF